MITKRDNENLRLREQRDQQAAELNERKHRDMNKLHSFNEIKSLLDSRTASIKLLGFTHALLTATHFTGTDSNSGVGINTYEDAYSGARRRSRSYDFLFQELWRGCLVCRRPEETFGVCSSIVTLILSDAYVRHVVVMLKSVLRRLEIVVLGIQKSGGSWPPRRSNSTSTNLASEIASPLYHLMLKHFQTNSSRKRLKFKDFSCSTSNTNKLVTFNPAQVSCSRCRFFLGRIVTVHRAGEVICCLGSARPSSEEQSLRSFCHGGKGLKE